MSKNISLLSLQIFNTTGGIQKMVRTLAHALDTLSKKRGWAFKLSSLYDDKADLMTQYLPSEKFEGYNEHVIRFILKTVFFKNKPDILILTHINLAVIGVLTRWFNPKCQILLFAHGIEVWRPLGLYKKLILSYADKIVCVSSFTKQQMYNWHKVPLTKCHVLNNAVDPFIALPEEFLKPVYLQDRYSIKNDQPILFTLTRLASTEQYKGHDTVLLALSKLKVDFPNIRYILSGKYDTKEGIRVKKMIAELNLADHVTLTGFIDEGELADHFLLADAFVLPSKKEGFGIVFIEALACGLPVICGDADGSLDAILNGELGTAVNADDSDELAACIKKLLSEPLTIEKRRALQSNCLKQFNENAYIDKLEQLLTS
ncbi:glycosyltransferase family 4 protein [Mucilaginibacter glaciei]|uniref:Glycosyltransferase family 4 protein n=1 Tax=Mucilaginibacter glaciei TaxID=2772109 RepID=A0A926NNC7_9SPHI|nr:glycosyltransferase family 4 protein [Mucilaginibacter glaciei]MBD1392911.1 glycosyltransferase family 4 protein [Mucilaginibacter glaciei]